MAKAWIVSHPETSYDKAGRVHGNQDPSLSDSGRQKAEKIGKQFKSKGIAKIHSSPRKRAHETAQIISKHTGAPVEVHKELEPWDLGSMSGAKATAIQPLLEFFSKRPNRKVPSGESKNAMLNRYKSFSKKLKPKEALVGHSQHIMAWDHVRKGGDASKVPMIGGKSGQIREVTV